jgi:hypothetical protein
MKKSVLGDCGARSTQDARVDGAVAWRHRAMNDKLKSSNYDRAHRTAQSIFSAFEI